jgi:hypothetical protein
VFTSSSSVPPSTGLGLSNLASFCRKIQDSSQNRAFLAHFFATFPLDLYVRITEACRSGEQHLSYVLYGTLKGRRFTLYIPEDLVPEVRCCLDNGRALQELLFEAGPRYIKALKRQRSSSSKRRRAETCPPLQSDSSALLIGR